MFEALHRRRDWKHPAEVLGEPVPYRVLLRMAQTRIDRAAETPARVQEVQDLLQQAEREAAVQPVTAFVDALRGLSLSETGANRALEEARSGYLAGTAQELPAASQSA